MDYYLGYSWFDNKNVPAATTCPSARSQLLEVRVQQPQVPCSDVTKKGVVNVTVDISNKSAVAGDETVFLFASYPMTKARRHQKELKAFARASIPANATARVTIRCESRISSITTTASKSWVVESGPVNVSVGPSSRNLPLKDTFMVK